MTLVNITQKYLQSGEVPIFKRIEYWIQPDIYFASSLSDINEFEENPPRKMNIFTGQKSAQILLNNIWIKSVKGYEDEDETRLRFCKLDGEFYEDELPQFLIKDKTKETFATWHCGDVETYLSQQKTFGFNWDTFVEIPLVGLRYNDYDAYRNLYGSGLYLESLEQSNRPRKRRKITEKLADFIPELNRLPELAVE